MALKSFKMIQESGKGDLKKKNYKKETGNENKNF